MPELERKRIFYSLGRHRGAVDFTVNDNHVVYCGTTDKDTIPTTTANDAARIMKAIAKEMKFSVEGFVFYELSTHKSWICRPGVYDFQRVMLISRYSGDKDPEWHREKCPPSILKLFRGEIGGEGDPISLAQVDAGAMRSGSRWTRNSSGIGHST